MRGKRTCQTIWYSMGVKDVCCERKGLDKMDSTFSVDNEKAPIFKVNNTMINKIKISDVIKPR
ncbi:hypothetical protein CHBNV3_01400 [Haemophilus influenzae]|nr:hypothetical protein CHBNV3_01400 [Haemophilus influenzae]